MARTHTREDLLHAIATMDGLSQGAFHGIETLAEMTIAAFERPDFQSDLEAVVHVLELIRDKAREAMNDINVQAEEVGANYKDAAKQRRMDAARANWTRANKVVHVVAR